MMVVMKVAVTAGTKVAKLVDHLDHSTGGLKVDKKVVS